MTQTEGLATQVAVTPPEQLLELVDRFGRYQDAYRSGRYKEARVRQEFINPLFGLLGWDVENRTGQSETYKDVVHEDAIQVGGGTKAPDYSFRIGGERRFFVEAKKPLVNLREHDDSAYQLRRYAWSAKLPLSVLTDFEELAVYDTCVRPDKNDSPSKARLKFMEYTEYPERWGEIASIFSKEAVLAGSLEEYACKTEGRRGTDTVNAAFLREIESWREALARDLAHRNPHLTQRQLNYAVQMTIDRIIFLRMAEDRGIEEYGRLLKLANGADIYDGLKNMFIRADERYNSGLFHFHQEKDRPYPDDLTLRLTIDDAVLKSVVTRLYYPDSPYEFSVLPIDVLGQVYEQFLGKVIRLSPDRKVEIEEKPEVRKAGGVYYTPTYIVDYIVKNTVGKLLRGKKAGPRGNASKLRILDPACGSGSFLIGAYTYLLDWHRDQYVADGPQKHQRELYQGPGGTWHLTTQEKKRILLNNIYGVDIDAQAVEVTKLSLLLKVLEGESEQSLVTQLSMFHERALPDLDENIKCGNSLIGPDYYDHVQTNFLDEDELYRINVFDWKVAFPEVFSGDVSGFDAVIGNPPYIRVHRLSREQKEYFWKHYHTFVAKSDIYACFIEKGIQLLRSEGRLSFITPNTWTSLESFTGLRQFVLSETAIEQLVRTPEKVFEGATVRTFVFVLNRTSKQADIDTAKARVREMTVGGVTHDVSWAAQSDMIRSHLSNLLLHSQSGAPALFARCTQSGVTVGSEFDFFYGFKTADDDLFLAAQRMNEFYEPFVRSADITRFGPLQPREYVDYRPEVMRANRQTARPGDRQRFERPKVVVARMGRLLIATFDDTGVFVKDAMLLLHTSDNSDLLKALTGVLNSRLLQYLYENYFATIDVLKNALLALPLPKHMDTTNSVASLTPIAKLVDRMLSLNGGGAKARTSHERNVIQRQIHTTDRQIDRLVYELYGLTDEEIRVVEQSHSHRG